MSTDGRFPLLFTSNGPTIVLQGVLSLSAIFLAASSLLFGWKYLKSRSPVLYWYTLGLILFALSMIAFIFMLKIGDSVNWGGRIGLYLTSLYFLLAVLSRGSHREKKSGLYENWADAFRNDSEQITVFFASMSEGVLYGKIITNEAGSAIDFVFLDVNPAYERISGIDREKVLGKEPPKCIQVRILNCLIGSILVGRSLSPGTGGLEQHSRVLDKWFHCNVFSPRKGYFVAILEDITERKKVGEELQTTQERFYRILSCMPYGILLVADNDRIEFANQAFCDIFGLKESPADLSNLPSTEMIEKIRAILH